MYYIFDIFTRICIRIHICTCIFIYIYMYVYKWRRQSIALAEKLFRLRSRYSLYIPLDIMYMDTRIYLHTCARARPHIFLILSLSLSLSFSLFMCVYTYRREATFWSILLESKYTRVPLSFTIVRDAFRETKFHRRKASEQNPVATYNAQFACIARCKWPICS